MHAHRVAVVVSFLCACGTRMAERVAGEVPEDSGIASDASVEDARSPLAADADADVEQAEAAVDAAPDVPSPTDARLDGIPPPPAGRGSLRFFGNNVPDQQVDRVRIKLDAPSVPADIGVGDFTVEVWLKTTVGGQGACRTGRDGWIFGRIFVDQDIIGDGDRGDYGLSLYENGTVAFGVSVGGNGGGACSTTGIADGQWHHIAAVRNGTSGALSLFIDGAADGTSSGPTGDASYRDGRSGAEADPYLTLGGEKHAFAGYPWYDGFMAELRLSTSRRYAGTFVRPSAPFVSDTNTAALYSMDEGAGVVLGDRSGAAGGPSKGALLIGGAPAGPVWSSDTPFP